MTKLSFAESFTRAIRAAKPEGWYARGLGHGAACPDIFLRAACRTSRSACRPSGVFVPSLPALFSSFENPFFFEAALCRYVCPVIHRGADGG